MSEKRKLNDSELEAVSGGIMAHKLSNANMVSLAKNDKRRIFFESDSSNLLTVKNQNEEA